MKVLLTFIDSLVSSHVYEIIRTIYNTPNSEVSSDEGRVPVLQHALQQLRLSNIATLDACMNHFTRLIDLTSADEAYISTLATSLAPCILRPRAETSLTLEEKHAYRLVRDLFAHKEPIFTALKRMSSLSHSTNLPESRPRAISTDESNRRAHMEERNRALLNKASGSRSRATSPAPGPRGGHRRDRSTAGPDTRFPIQVASPTSSNERHRSSLGSGSRMSLEVPGDAEAGHVPSASDSPARNGVGESATDGLPSKRDSLSKRESLSTTRDSFSKRESLSTSRDSLSTRDSLSNRDSLTRGDRTKFLGGKRITPVAEAPRGVTLEDKPMDM